VRCWDWGPVFRARCQESGRLLRVLFRIVGIIFDGVKVLAGPAMVNDVLAIEEAAHATLLPVVAA